MRKLGIVLNLYQPITQEEKKLREVAESSYLPIIKIIKNRKEFRPTLNIPLGLLQQMSFPDLKGFLEEERVEMIGSSAYNAVLTGLPENLATNEVILNEYGLGYFFGRRSGFEGELAVLMKDLKGFYPSRMAYDSDVLNLIESLGYGWMLVDPVSTDGRPGIFKLKDRDCHIVAYNSSLSDKILAKTDMNIEDVIEEIRSADDGILVLDAEFFGHKNRDGIYLLNKLLDKLNQMNIEMVPVSEFIEEEIDETRVLELKTLAEKKYEPSDEKLWGLNKSFVKVIENYLKSIPKLEVEGMENVALWGNNLPREVQLTVLSAQICDSTQFESKEVSDGILKLYLELAELLADETLLKLVNQHGK